MVEERLSENNTATIFLLIGFQQGFMYQDIDI